MRAVTKEQIRESCSRGREAGLTDDDMAMLTVIINATIDHINMDVSDGAYDDPETEAKLKAAEPTEELIHKMVGSALFQIFAKHGLVYTLVEITVDQITDPNHGKPY